MTLPWNRALPLALSAVLALPLAPAPAAAQEEDPVSLELFGSYLRQQSAKEEAIGLRAGYRFTSRWALETSLSRLAVSDANLWLADLSAKAYLTPGGRAELFALAGAGGFRVVGNDEPTVHVGLGAEVDLGEHSYLRPEVRARWLADAFDVDPVYDYSLGIGFRF